MLEKLFYLSGILCVYSYFLYPLLFKLLPARKRVANSGRHRLATAALSNMK